MVITNQDTHASKIGVKHNPMSTRKVVSGPSESRLPINTTRDLIPFSTEPPANRTLGLLLVDFSLNPISCNDEAIRILSYPALPENIQHLGVFLRDAIRTRLLKRQSSSCSRFVTEFVSGKRCYRCRLFHLDWDIRDNYQPALELLLERSLSGLLSLDRTAQQFNFSPREQQTVEFLLQGLSSKEIADRMKISPNTVNTFFRLVMIKMGVSSRFGILGKMISANSNSSPISMTSQTSDGRGLDRRGRV
jgi:DNA-binding CsgD family transcriptional regulator